LSDTLETATRFFEEHRAEWIAAGHQDSWASVSETTLIGFYGSFEDAFQAGAKDHAPGTFLVKQVKPTDTVETIQRVFLKADR
jgi:hypothetical protein